MKSIISSLIRTLPMIRIIVFVSKEREGLLWEVSKNTETHYFNFSPCCNGKNVLLVGIFGDLQVDLLIHSNREPAWSVYICMKIQVCLFDAWQVNYNLKRKRYWPWYVDISFFSGNKTTLYSSIKWRVV